MKQGNCTLAHLPSEDVGEDKSPDDEEPQHEEDLQLLCWIVADCKRDVLVNVTILVEQS